jgi:hypothetical protein
MRRLLRVYGVLTGVGLAVTAGTLATVAWADTTVRTGSACPMSAVAVPAGLTAVQISGADPSGRYLVGTAQDGSGQLHLVRWDGGTPADLGIAHSGGAAVNRHGDVVGAEYDVTVNGYHPWRYHAGQFVALPVLNAGHGGYPAAITPDGTVVGTADDPTGNLTQPVVWSAAGEIRALALPAGDNYGTVVDADTDGSFVGVTGFDPRDTSFVSAQPTVWNPDGTVRRLLALPGTDPQRTGRPLGVAGGAVVGVETSSAGQQWLRWPRGGGEPTVRPGTGYPLLMNKRGAVVFTEPPGAFALLRGGTVHVLTSPEPSIGRSVSAVTNTNQVYGRFDDQPVRWDCHSA